jgi:hypothetical protein
MATINITTLLSNQVMTGEITKFASYVGFPSRYDGIEIVRPRGSGNDRLPKESLMTQIS